MLLVYIYIYILERDSIVMNTLENLRKENENMKLAFKEKEKGYKIHIEELEKKLYQITLAVNNMKEINKELLIQISEHVYIYIYIYICRREEER